MDTILNIHQISHSYHTLKGETPALCDISFSVNQGEFLAIVGPSGCGKSTLLSLISGLLKPEQGEILLHEKPVEEQPSRVPEPDSRPITAMAPASLPNSDQSVTAPV